MSTLEQIFFPDLSCLAKVDLRTKYNYAMKWSDAVLTVDLATATTDKPAGVLTRANNITLDVAIRCYGLAAGITGASVTIGDSLTVDGAGKFVTAVPISNANVWCWGFARATAGGTGELITIFLFPHVYAGVAGSS